MCLENEIIVKFNTDRWRILVNGIDISDRFNDPSRLIHRNSWSEISQIESSSMWPVRQLEVESTAVPADWSELSEENCGLIRSLSYKEKISLGTADLQTYNKGNGNILDSAAKERDGWYFQGLRDATPRYVKLSLL